MTAGTITAETVRGDRVVAVVDYLADVARSIPELGLRVTEVDELARSVGECTDIDTAALQEDLLLLQARIRHLDAVPAALDHAVTALPAAWAGRGGVAAALRAADCAALVRADLARAAAIADTLATAATGIDEVREHLGRRLAAIDVAGIAGWPIPAVRAALDGGDVEQGQIDAWAGAVRAAVELVVTGADTTRADVDSILGIATAAFGSTPTTRYPDRRCAQVVGETSIPATPSVGLPVTAPLDLLDVVLRIATAAGSIAENVVTAASAGIEAAAAITSSSLADNDSNAVADTESGPDEPIEPTAQPAAEPGDADPVEPDSGQRGTEERDADPAGMSAPMPVPEQSQPMSPAAEPPPVDGAPESDLALLGDS